MCPKGNWVSISESELLRLRHLTLSLILRGSAVTAFNTSEYAENVGVGASHGWLVRSTSQSPPDVVKVTYTIGIVVYICCPSQEILYLHPLLALLP